jgi:hypothetical protein
MKMAGKRAGGEGPCRAPGWSSDYSEVCGESLGCTYIPGYQFG